jgi:SPP1 gp7 family putative phage head morphogenesis protein
MARSGRPSIPPTLPSNVEHAMLAVEAALQRSERAFHRDFARLIDETLHAGAEAAMIGGELTVLARRRVTWKFDRTAPDVINWVSQHAAKRVADINLETRRALREAITRGLSLGLRERQLAELIQPLLGLTRRQGAAALKKYEAWVPKIGAQRAAAATKRYMERQLKKRALDIAKTETIAAANEGQRQMWLQARRRGVLPRFAKRQWITARDEKTCPVCRPMDGQMVELTEPFSVAGPPAHTRCRCAQVLVSDAGVGTVTTKKSA